jgi:hypothetical protein
MPNQDRELPIAAGWSLLVANPALAFRLSRALLEFALGNSNN